MTAGIGLIIVYFLHIVLVAWINRAQISLQLGSSEISQTTISGVLAEAAGLLLILILIVFPKMGLLICQVLMFINLCSLCIPLLLYHSMSVLPGIMIVVVNEIIVCILHMYLKRQLQTRDAYEQMANTDVLTNLPNRRYLYSYLDELTANDKNRFAVVFVDVDNFKKVNDSMGHEVGDKVLRKIADTLCRAADKKDLIARLGGDEFSIVVHDVNDKEALLAHVEHITAFVKEKFTIEDREFYSSISMGVACFPEDGRDVNRLLQCADTAMYYAKRSGKATACMFRPEMLRVVEQDMKMEIKIREAMQEKRMFLLYQPQFYTQNGKLRGFEALARIRDTDGKIIPPGEFIPVAEQNGLICELEHYVLAYAMRQFLPYVKDRDDDFKLCINISVIHLEHKDFVQEIKGLLKETGFPPCYLELEVTESVFISSADRAKQIMDELKKLGIAFALDDFGTGYASLGYLSRLPIDTLKIDKVFIDQISQENNGKDFAKAVVSLGHEMKFEIVSEGVEYPEQLEYLKQLDCDYIQGYLLGKPLEMEKAEQLMKQ